MGAESKVSGGARTSTQPRTVVPTLSPYLLSSNETSGSHTAEISNTKSRTKLQTLLQWRDSASRVTYIPTQVHFKEIKTPST